MKGTMAKSSNTMPLGMRLCGSSYMDAYNFYWNLGEFYFGLVSKNKGILPAAKASYIIAAENLNTVRKESDHFID
jgi:hypothetical protein